MRQIANWLGTIPMAANDTFHDYWLRGKFPWLDSMNDWLNDTWLGAPMPMWMGIFMWIMLILLSFGRR